MPTDRYSHKSRSIRTTLTRTPWRTRTRKQKATKTLTPAEKEAAKKIARERKENNNKLTDNALLEVWKLAEDLHTKTGTNTAQYWYEFLLQRSGKGKSTRRASTWNAFVSNRVRQHNDALPPDVPRVKATGIMDELLGEWNGLTSAEKSDLTEEWVAQLEETREMKDHATHSVPLRAFHDARANLKSIQDRLLNLHHRSGHEFMLISCRSNSTGYMHPSAWSTGEYVDDYFQMQFKKSTADFAMMLESYMLSGLNGVVKTAQDELTDLKHKTARIIATKLELAARPDRVARMFYQDFEQHITLKYGIICENWPLEEFVSPCRINSRDVLNTLFHAWESGATYFRRLSPSELTERQRDQARARMAAHQATIAARSAATMADQPNITPPNTDPAFPNTELAPPNAVNTHSPVTALMAGPSTAVPPPSQTYQNIVFSSGMQPLPEKKKRQKRSDAGQKRPHAKKRKAKSQGAATSATGSNGSA